VGDSPETVSIVSNVQSDDLLFLAQDRREATDLSTERSPDVLRGVGNKVLHTSHDLIEESIAIDQVAEAY
jgi:hypothetical protein